jgi:hypothetical protein
MIDFNQPDAAQKSFHCMRRAANSGHTCDGRLDKLYPSETSVERYRPRKSVLRHAVASGDMSIWPREIVVRWK